MVDFQKLLDREKYLKLRYELDNIITKEEQEIAIEYNEIGWFILD